ncbi:MAG: hypothetical protein ABIB71_06200 [Candidatus Woesearchaeota archaeon]
MGYQPKLKNEKEYDGLLAFRDVVIPKLLGAGYTRHNVNHSSIFWLYAGKDNTEQHLVCVSSHSFDIVTDEVDRVKVFTKMDLERLMRLEK